MSAQRLQTSREMVEVTLLEGVDPAYVEVSLSRSVKAPSDTWYPVVVDDGKWWLEIGPGSTSGKLGLGPWNLHRHVTNPPLPVVLIDSFRVIGTDVIPDGPAGVDTDEIYVQLAANPDSLIVGAVTRDGNGAATSAGVVWPDGVTGFYTADVVSSAFPGAVDSYHLTYGNPLVVRTYTQPAVTRDVNGAVTFRPGIVVV